MMNIIHHLYLKSFIPRCLVCFDEKRHVVLYFFKYEIKCCWIVVFLYLNED